MRFLQVDVLAAIALASARAFLDSVSRAVSLTGGSGFGSGSCCGSCAISSPIEEGTQIPLLVMTQTKAETCRITGEYLLRGQAEAAIGEFDGIDTDQASSLVPEHRAVAGIDKPDVLKPPWPNTRTSGRKHLPWNRLARESRSFE
jgi:hypothetical protein